MRNEIRRLMRSAGDALRGWIHILQFERNARYLVALVVLTTAAGAVGIFPPEQTVALLLAAALALGLEILNTAIEDLSDLVEPGYCEQVARIKDMAGAAVTVGLVLYVILAVAFLLA